MCILNWHVCIVLSAYLFAVHLDELSVQQGTARLRCTVGNMVVNHLLFGDDTVYARLVPVSVSSPSSEHLLWLYYWTWNCFQLQQDSRFIFPTLKVQTPCNTSCCPEWQKFEFRGTSQISCCIPSCLTEGWNDTLTQVKSFYCAENKLRSRHLFSVVYCSQKHSASSLLHANVCLWIIVQAHRLLVNASALPTMMSVTFCITSPGM